MDASPAPLDPEIAIFLSRLQEAARRFPDPTTVPVTQARAHARAIRAPWGQGGPAMARTIDRTVPGPARPIPVRCFHSTTEPGLPAVFFLHGGGWTLLGLDTHDRLMRELAAASGAVVVGIDYPLAPEAPFPAAIEETVAVIRHVAAQGHGWDIDPGRLAIAGDSAGANLALAASLALRDAGETLLRAGLLAYGAWDTDLARRSHRVYGDGSYLLSTARMAWFWNNYTPGDRRREPLATPLHADLHGLPPQHLTIAECDVLADENRELAKRLAAAGVETEAAIYPGTIHAFLEATSIAAVSRRAIAAQAAWLARHVGRP